MTVHMIVIKWENNVAGLAEEPNTETEEPITDECIVIVQHKDTSYYNATRKNDQNRKYAMFYKIKTRR